MLEVKNGQSKDHTQHDMYVLCRRMQEKFVFTILGYVVLDAPDKTMSEFMIA